MHDKTPHAPPRCATATRIRELLSPSGLLFVMQAMPPHLHAQMNLLLDASTEEEFRQIHQEAVYEYASLCTPHKRELIRRLCTILHADALEELGRALDPPPLGRTIGLGVCRDKLLHALGPELSDRLAAVFEAQTQETLEHASNRFAEALEADPDRASAAAEEPGLRLVLATLRLVGRNRRSAPPRSVRTSKLSARLALAWKSLRGGVLSGALGLTAPPLLATAGALLPFLVHALGKLPPEVLSELHARLRTLQSPP